jgi:hypothetical protein
MNGAKVIDSGASRATQESDSCAEYEGKDEIRVRCAGNSTVTMIQMEEDI